MNSAILLVEQLDEATSAITLNRPERRNALTIELMQSICEAMSSLASQTGQRVVILRGAGPAFCSGLDLNEASRVDIAADNANWVAKLFDTVACSPLITIAAAHGAAYAGGAGLLASCDFAVASDDLKLAFPEVRRGLLPALVAVLLKDRIHDGDARELFLVAEPITAARAHAIGLVHRVVPASQVMEEARSLAQSILKGAPDAVRQTKRLLRRLRGVDISAELTHALESHKQGRSSSEAAEGLAAFLEHREPAWTQSNPGPIET